MEKYGKWKVIKKETANWLCECECGTKRLVPCHSLKNGTSKSCGCVSHEKLKNYNLKKRSWLVGKKINMLLVLEEYGQDKGKNITYKCLCDCSNIIIVTGSRLKVKNIFSCGCKRTKRKSKNYTCNIGKTNNYLEIIEYLGKINNYQTYKYKCICGNIVEGPYYKFKYKNNSCGCIKTISKHKDLTGQRFNRLKVIKKSLERRTEKICWDCLCDCGNTVINVPGTSLSKGDRKSCGCLKKEKLQKNFIGKKYGSYVVVKEGKPKKIGKYNKIMRYWLCECSCGYIKEVSQRHLKNLGLFCSVCKPKQDRKIFEGVRGNYIILEKIQNELYLCECINCGTKKEFTHAQLVTKPKSCKVCEVLKKEKLLEELVEKTYKSFKIIKSFRQNNIIYVKYQCQKCNKTKNIVYSTFKNLNECSCVKLEKLNKKYVGKKYNRLTITKLESKTVVYTVCECGKIPKPVNLSSLKSNTSKSCGCLKIESCKSRSGKHHYNWQGGTYNTKMDKIRRSTGYKKWRNAVFMRDNYTCKKCDLKNVSELNGIKTLSYKHKLVNKLLTAHHLVSFKDNPKVRLNIDNGVTLCIKCHNTFHLKYGNVDFTFENYVEYINS